MHGHFGGIGLTFASLEQLRHQMDHVVRDFGWVRPPAVLRASGTPGLIDTGDAYTFRVALPGLTEADVQITVTPGELHLVAQRNVAVPDGYRAEWRERGDFQVDHKIAFPSSVDPAGVAAKLQDGVLSIRAPKARGIEPKKITVVVQ